MSATLPQNYSPDRDRAVVSEWFRLTGMFVHIVTPTPFVQAAIDRLHAHAVLKMEQKKSEVAA